MNDFESTLATALRGEAEEIAMNVDLTNADQELDRRLDAADSTRTKRRAVWAAVAVAAIVVGIGTAVVVRGTTTNASPPTVATPSPSSTTPTVGASPFVGEWQTSFTKSQAKSLLAANGLGAGYDRVMKEFPKTGEKLAWRLQVDPSEYRLLLVRDDGSTESFDLQRYGLTGRTLTADPTNSEGKRVVFDAGFGDGGTSLVLRLVRDDTASLAPGVPDEAIQRVLYTTGTWTKVA